MADNGMRMTMKMAAHWWSSLKRRLRLPRAGEGRDEFGITYIEIAFMMLIVSILVVSMVNAIINVSKASISAKEHSRALAIARDRMEQVKQMGYNEMILNFSNYYYPDQPDANNPLYQSRSALPYPATVPTAAQDPWTPENILEGATTYWRHVVVKFVEETPSGPTQGQLRQSPPPNPPTVVGGDYTLANLAYIEVDVTWYSRRLGGMQQVRVSTLVANQSAISQNLGTISGTVVDDGSAGASDSTNPCPPCVLSADDKRITWAQLAVVATDINTGIEYSAPVIKGTAVGITGVQGGTYRIKNLPNGSYWVELHGQPAFDDSAWNGYTTEPSVSGQPEQPVSVSSATPDVKAVNIFTYEAKATRIMGRYMGVTGTQASPHTLEIECNDKLSQPLVISVTYVCDATTPCWFNLPNVAYPPSGAVNTYTIVLNDKTAQLSTNAQVCLDGSTPLVPAATVFIGANPLSYSPMQGCGTCSWCQNPSGAYTPLNVTGSYTNATVSLLVKEYNGMLTPSVIALPAADYPLCSVSMYNSSTGVSVVQNVSAAGAATFSVPPSSAGQIEFIVNMSTTGFATDTYFLPFDVEPGASYDLVEGDPPGTILANQQHTFRIVKVASVSGTIWKSCVGGSPPCGTGSAGFPSAKVSIHNDTTGWSNVVTADSNGFFSVGQVPIENTPYRVEPVAGSEFNSNPVTRDTNVNANGVNFSVDASNSPLQYLLAVINGEIKGTVYKTNTANKITTGAVVIACAPSGGNPAPNPFPTTMPAASLAGYYVFSTVTLSDGTYDLKVATGVGNYYLYAYTFTSGAVVLASPFTTPSTPAGGLTVPSNTVVTQDITIP